MSSIVNLKKLNDQISSDKTGETSKNGDISSLQSVLTDVNEHLKDDSINKESKNPFTSLKRMVFGLTI